MTMRMNAIYIFVNYNTNECNAYIIVKNAQGVTLFTQLIRIHSFL